jgi:5-formyltetrahydrofolate cyclo-ligase
MRPERHAAHAATPAEQHKIALRVHYRALRRGLDDTQRRALDAQAQRALIASPAFAQAHTIALYQPFDGEVHTAAIAQAAEPRQVLYARHRVDAPLEFVAPTGWQYLGRNKLPVPLGPAIPLPADALVVVPGVAFDGDGYRLGLGGGHYDRTLAEHDGPSIGLAYSFQVVEQLPREPWDVPVGALATDAVCRFDPEEKKA